MVDPAWAGAAGDFAFMENPASLPVMLVRACNGLPVSILPGLCVCLHMLCFSILTLRDVPPLLGGQGMQAVGLHAAAHDEKIWSPYFTGECYGPQPRLLRAQPGH